jgi:hypothetical protein
MNIYDMIAFVTDWWPTALLVVFVIYVMSRKP